MFPDGNASVARLLVQKMIPSVAPDMGGPHDVAIARFNYGELDRDEHSCSPAPKQHCSRRSGNQTRNSDLLTMCKPVVLSR
jgi:hypothetical protein